MPYLPPVLVTPLPEGIFRRLFFFLYLTIPASRGRRASFPLPQRLSDRSTVSGCGLVGIVIPPENKDIFALGSYSMKQSLFTEQLFQNMSCFHQAICPTSLLSWSHPCQKESSVVSSFSLSHYPCLQGSTC